MMGATPMWYQQPRWRSSVRVAPEIVLSDEERAELVRLVRSKLTSVRLAQRAGMVLLAADGLQNLQIAEQLGVGRIQVARWRERYGRLRLAGIERDLPRGAPPVKVDVARLVRLTTQTLPKAATQWSTRTMAAELGVRRAGQEQSRVPGDWHAPLGSQGGAGPLDRTERGRKILAARDERDPRARYERYPDCGRGWPQRLP